MIQNALKHESGVHQSGFGALVEKKLRNHFSNECCGFNALGGIVLYRFSCSNEMDRNTPKHESRVQRSGLGAFVAKKLGTHFVIKGCAFNALDGSLCIVFRAVTK